nr:MAG TPA: hypothetical protein [Caudoviricetes sp.]DAY67671.1 MAG TPA: hypothetical protein [Caudoviricetes sp.]
MIERQRLVLTAGPCSPWGLALRTGGCGSGGERGRH